MLYYSIMDINNILDIETNPDIKKLLNILESPGHYYDIYKLNPFEILITIHYKGAKIWIIRYTAHTNKYRCKGNGIFRKRDDKTTAELRKQLEFIYINFNKKPLEIVI